MKQKSGIRFTWFVGGILLFVIMCCAGIGFVSAESGLIDGELFAPDVSYQIREGEFDSYTNSDQISEIYKIRDYYRLRACIHRGKVI